MTSRELAVARSVIYASLFDYPLTLPQLHRTLIESEQTPSEILAVYDGSARLQTIVDHRDGFFFPVGRADLIAERRLREARSRRFLDEHHAMLRLLCALPFTRLVALSGSVAHLNLEPDGDLDLFIVTRGRRVWTVTVAVLLGPTVFRVSPRCHDWRGVSGCSPFGPSKRTSPSNNAMTGNSAGRVRLKMKSAASPANAKTTAANASVRPEGFLRIGLGNDAGTTIDGAVVTGCGPSEVRNGNSIKESGSAKLFWISAFTSSTIAASGTGAESKPAISELSRVSSRNRVASAGSASNATNSAASVSVSPSSR